MQRNTLGAKHEEVRNKGAKGRLRGQQNLQQYSCTDTALTKKLTHVKLGLNFQPNLKEPM